VKALARLAVVFALSAALLPCAAEPRPEPHRSPVDVVLLPDGRAVCANHTADSVSLVDLRIGKVLAETPCGDKPAALACSRDGQHVAVSNLWSGSVTLFEVRKDSLHSLDEIAVGALPRGLAFAPDGKHCYVALSGQDEIAEIDCTARKVTQRFTTGRQPGQVAVSKNGAWLAATSQQPGQVRLWSLKTRQLHWARTIEDAFNLCGLCFTPEETALICVHSVRREFPVSKANIEEGWVIDSRLSRLPLNADATTPHPADAALQQIALDRKGEAVGDPHGLAFAPSGRVLALSAGGTHELLLFDVKAIPWASGDPGDFVNETLTKNDGKLRRLPLDGRPLNLVFTANGEQIVVANYLLDGLQLVDVKTGQIVRTIALGGPEKPSLARRGEALFYDAKRSHQQWFSCHTCHVDGHTCGLNFDTLNDDSYGNPKLTPSLRRVTHTGPWTWHGWQTDLAAGVEKSFTQTMFGPKPSTEELNAVVAFLDTLDHPPNPHRSGGELRPATQRGEKLFTGKARCSRCHDGPDYTAKRNYDVKLEADGSPYDLWNPPSLRGLWERGPYLHDGRAKTLDELLRTPHSPEKLGGEKLTDAEGEDLMAFLLSL
jgi:YVTN family beta-propeller protein